MTTASDSFTRANESPVTTPWATSYGGGLNLTSNVLISTASADRGSVYNSGAWGAGQSAQGIVGALSDSTQYAGVLVRADTSGNAFQFVTDGTTGAGHTAIYRWDAGVGTELGGIATTFANGNGIRLDVSGTSPDIVLTAYKDTGGGYSQVGQLTGVTGHNTGNPGAGNFGAGTLDDWSATDGGELSMGRLDNKRIRPRAFAPGVAR